MTFNLKEPYQRIDFKKEVQRLLDESKIVQIKTKNKSRTITQNKAIHLFFNFIATKLNENGIEYVWTGLKGVPMSTRYNDVIVKNFLWKPIQSQLFEKESTTELLTNEVSEVAEVIIKALAEIGISIQFPSFQSWCDSQLIKQYQNGI